jgi:hypothetical protein
MVREYFHPENGAFRRPLPTKGALWVNCRTQSVLFKKLADFQKFGNRGGHEEKTLCFSYYKSAVVLCYYCCIATPKKGIFH